MRSIAVVGASLAGLEAARTLRRLGFDGRLVIVGEEAEAPYDRPPLSKQFLAGEWDRERISLRSEEPALRAEWRLGVRATGLDAGTRTLRCDDGEVEPFDGIVIATGAAPRRLGTRALAGLHVLRTVGESETLHAELALTPGRVAIIGAGFIGAEVAATCRGLGLQVTVVEALAAPLENVVGWQVGSALADVHRGHGVDLRLGVTVAAIAGEERVTGLELSDGSRLAADVVVVAIGVEPSTAWLEGSGLSIDRGVLCDEACLAAPGIVAAGDVARWPNRRYGEVRRVEHWENAIRQGEHAARRLLAQDGQGAVEPYAPVPWFWSDQYDRKLQLAGSPAGAEEVHVIAVGEGRMLALYRRGERLVAVFSLSQGRAMVRYRRLLDQDPTWADGLAASEKLVTA